MHTQNHHTEYEISHDIAYKPREFQSCLVAGLIVARQPDSKVLGQEDHNPKIDITICERRDRQQLHQHHIVGQGTADIGVLYMVYRRFTLFPHSQVFGDHVQCIVEYGQVKGTHEDIAMAPGQL